MKLLAVLIFTLCCAGTLPVSSVHASPLLIPAAAYPSGAHITFRPSLSNGDMDCRWGFICEGGYPLFHYQTQDDLHRLAGWAEFAGIHRHGRMTMAFQLYASTYDPSSTDSDVACSESAFRDLQSALSAHRYRADPQASSLLVSTRPGSTLVAVQRSGEQDLVVMAAWSGTTEIEGIALYDHASPSARQTAWTSLALQIQLASARGV